MRVRCGDRVGRWNEHLHIIKRLVEGGEEICVLGVEKPEVYIEALKKLGLVVEGEPVKSSNRSKVFKNKVEERIVGYSFKLKPIKMEELKVDVGDWIVDKNGKTRKITGDDMPDLVYEDIVRKLTEEESPEFEFALMFGSEWTNLNKENLFNPLMKKCPLAVTSFCKWIDKYKKDIGWEKLFNSDSNWQDADGKNAPAPKFHDLPWTMQFGILMDFFCDTFNGCAYNLDGIDWTEPEEVAQRIVDDFIFLEIGIRNGDYEA